MCLWLNLRPQLSFTPPTLRWSLWIISKLLFCTASMYLRVCVCECETSGLPPVCLPVCLPASCVPDSQSLCLRECVGVSAWARIHTEREPPSLCRESLGFFLYTSIFFGIRFWGSLGFLEIQSLCFSWPFLSSVPRFHFISFHFIS